jgi:hypothetical protein
MKFSIHSIYTQIFKLWRQKRRDLFVETIAPTPNDIMLDVGGYPSIWSTRSPMVKQVDCLNIHPVEWSEETAPQHHISTVTGDGCALQYGDRSYDVLFSNSVIEHVGNWDRQCAFAAEVQRVGKKLWIQTPAYECPLEPHYLAPFVHWLPVPIREVCVRWFTPWAWITRPSKAEVHETVRDTQLLTKRQVRELFPECTILTERLLWVFPKSYVAYRVDREPFAEADSDLPAASQPGC